MIPRGAFAGSVRERRKRKSGFDGYKEGIGALEERSGKAGQRG